MTPSTTNRFDITNNKLRVTDTFNYGSIIFNSAFGNVTAKIGNTIFHTNTDFDANADIVIGTNTYVDIDLPVSGGKIQPGSYTIIYNLLVNYGADVTAPVSDVFSSIVINPTSAPFIAQIAALLTEFDTVTIQFLNGDGDVLNTSTVTGTTSPGTISFDEIEIEQAATDVASILIAVTYTLEDEYLFNECDAITASINATQNCAAAQVTVKDTTSYPAYTGLSLTREMTINYPTGIDGQPVEDPVVTTDASKTIGPPIWSGNYTINLVSTVTWTQSDGLLILQTAEAQNNLLVKCDASLCKALKCIEGLRQRFMAAIKNGSRDYAELTRDILVVNSMVMTYQIAIQCQDTELAASILTELIVYLEMGNCSCGCEETTGGSNIPTIIYPLYSTN